jgi:hypothetical protein
MIGVEIGHELVALVIALSPVKPERKCDYWARSLGSAGVSLSSMVAEDRAGEHFKN